MAYMAEYDTRFTEERKTEIINVLMTEKKLPDFSREVSSVSYMDGCKVYFKNGGWIVARFSGTEPLLRIFCEMETEKLAVETREVMTDFLQL
jgi:phosphomannomutase